jgi:hypothetical protein
MRKLKGYEGDVFEPKSPASIQVLEEMRTALREEGFAAARDRHKTTLRVYPIKNGQYPLMNPRLVDELGVKEGSDPEDPNAEPAFREVVCMNFWSPADDDMLDRIYDVELPDGTYFADFLADDDEEEDDEQDDEAEGEEEADTTNAVETADVEDEEEGKGEEAGAGAPDGESDDSPGLAYHGYLIIPLTFTESEDGASLDLTLFRSAMRAFRVPFA